MKNEKRKKGKTDSGKRSNKAKAKKNSGGTKGKRVNDSKKRSKATNRTNVGHAKRNRSQRSIKLSKAEREIYRGFEALLKEDAKIKPAKVRKKKGDNLFIIDLRQRGFQNKILALRNADFSSIEKFLKKQSVEPLYALVTLKIKKPDDVGYYFNAQKSPADMVVNAMNTKDFALQVLTDYNNDMVDLIQEQYDELIKVYNVVELSIRFLFLRK